MNTYKTTLRDVVQTIQMIKMIFQDLKNVEERLRGYINESYTDELKNIIKDLDIINDDFVELENYINSKDDKIIIVLE